MTPPANPRTWLDCCAAFGHAHDVAPELLEALRAFASPHPRGGPPQPPEPPWDGAFEALERAWSEPIAIADLTALLAGESEGRQPATFARRTAATEGILRRLGTPAARILRVGLRIRLHGIGAAPAPRLKRIRALADFYYSYAARLLHPQWAAEPHRLGALVRAGAWRTVAAGLEHATLDGLAEGMPVHVNVLRADPAQISVRVRNLTSLTSGGQSFAEAVGPGALAAVSGGFFLYSESDIEPPSRRHDPVGLLLIDGVMRGAPVFRRAALLAADGVVGMRHVGLEDVSIRIDGRGAPPARCINRAEADVGPDAPSVAVVDQRIVAVGSRLPVPLNGYVAVPHDGLTPALRVGALVEYGAPRLSDGTPATEGVSGGPLLLADGVPVLDMRSEDFWGTAPPITFSQDETGDLNLLARMLAGLDAEGHLVVAAVDGRNAKRALGMTLGDGARLMKMLGCHTAMNLDGGSSKRMLVEGRVVDLPSTEIVAGESAVVRIRAVHSAVRFEARNR